MLTPVSGGVSTLRPLRGSCGAKHRLRLQADFFSEFEAQMTVLLDFWDSRVLLTYSSCLANISILSWSTFVPQKNPHHKKCTSGMVQCRRPIHTHLYHDKSDAISRSLEVSITFTARHLKRHIIRGLPIMPNLFRHSKEHLWVTAKHSGYGPYSSLRLKSSCGPARALKYRIPGVHKAGTPCEIISIS